MIGRLRLQAQGLLATEASFSPTPADVVRHTTAMQAQDLPSAMWAVGLRVHIGGGKLSLESVRAAINSGEIVRSWPMRGTLHLVMPEDLGWILELTSDRLHRAMKSRFRELEITDADLDQCAEVAVELVAQARNSGADGGTRAELFDAWERAGQRTKAQRGITMLGTLCRMAVLVQGPLEGNQQLFREFNEWIPFSRRLEREQSVAELAQRYFASHGPATMADFSSWSKLPITEVRRAMEVIGDKLEKRVINEREYWCAPDLFSGIHKVPGARSVLALPGFDEFILGYADRDDVLDPQHAAKIVPGGNGVFLKTIVVGGRVCGTWAHQCTGPKDVVEPLAFSEQMRPAAQKYFEQQAAKYLRFLAS
ncbi:winged helix DNA-binding domain-containing protein [Pseudarthrobacter sp. J1763]|uniref:winged helix DNA-binding domain-containing protein n=1 Tax=Pseudarthrobacter sp. J1763 TaxID=3420445 RepID=UPI003D27D977